MKISIIGAGYVGMVTGACLAKLGHNIVLIDIEPAKIKAINQKKSPPIYEEGLEELLGQVDIKASSDYRLLKDAEVIFICVGTMADKAGRMSSEHLVAAVRNISAVLRDRNSYYVVVVKSTVSPGTTEKLVIPILEQYGGKAGKDFGICTSPEFLMEGKAIADFMNPARIIIGEGDSRAGDVVAGIFSVLGAPVLRTSLRTAEMIKLASNVGGSAVQDLH